MGVEEWLRLLGDVGMPLASAGVVLMLFLRMSADASKRAAEADARAARALADAEDRAKRLEDRLFTGDGNGTRGAITRIEDLLMGHLHVERPMPECQRWNDERYERKAGAVR